MEMTILIALLILAAVYLGFRVVGGYRSYHEFRGPLLAICPETKKSVLVELAAEKMAMKTVLGKPHFRLKKCSRWPEREGCGQECLQEIEGRFPESEPSSTRKKAS
ncbi:MAG TPA: hypothetical protein VNI36_03605 [Candidatus Dormibacteraeota bacterium]|nr:hypothetical protein [Candidatus Dormibacteraeota bacterium]